MCCSLWAIARSSYVAFGMNRSINGRFFFTLIDSGCTPFPHLLLQSVILLSLMHSFLCLPYKKTPCSGANILFEIVSQTTLLSCWVYACYSVEFTYIWHVGAICYCDINQLFTWVGLVIALYVARFCECLLVRCNWGKNREDIERAFHVLLTTN